MNAKLIQTPDGEWLQPDAIGSININSCVNVTSQNVTKIWSVSVISKKGELLSVVAAGLPDLDAAQRYAATIAEHVNFALS